MVKRRTSTAPTLLDRTYEVQLGVGDGRWLSKGTVCRLNGRNGWYRFLYAGNGGLTFWGPCNEEGSAKGSAQFTSVHEDEVGKFSNRKRRDVQDV